MVLVLLALAIGPGLILVHVVWAADRNREPVWHVLAYVGAGAAILQLTAIVEGLAGIESSLHVVATHPWSFIASMLVVGLVEESAKLLTVWRRGIRDKVLDEPFDWLVYTVAVSLGLGTLENVLYVLHGGVSVGLARAFSAVPLHALCGTLMGTRLAEARRAPDAASRRRAWVLALVEPVAWHGIYDALCGFMATGNEMAAVCQVALMGGLWREAYRRTLVLRDAQPTVPCPPILLPEIVLDRRRGRRTARGARRATSLAAAMRGEIPADAPARRHPRPRWFERDGETPRA